LDAAELRRCEAAVAAKRRSDGRARSLRDFDGGANAELYNAWIPLRVAVHAREEAAALRVALRRRGGAIAGALRAVLGANPAQPLVDAIAARDDPAPLRASGLDLVRSCTGLGTSSTWLHLACTSAPAAPPRSVPFLLAAGADVRARDMFGDTPLHNAAREGHAASVAALLAAGADVAASNLLSFTPLHLACQHGQLAAAALLCAAGAPQDGRTISGGSTPLMLAIDAGRARVVALLLAPGSAAAGAIDFRARLFPPYNDSTLFRTLRPNAARAAMRVRQLVVEEACRRECGTRGSGDPDGLLGLHGGPRAAAMPPTWLASPFAALLLAGGGGHFPGARGYVPDSDAPRGAARDAALQRDSAHHLRDGCRVVRYRDGATVLAPRETMAPSEFIAPGGLLHRGMRTPCVLAFLEATHPRLGEHSAARILVRDR
jgi:hypothetical protein